MRSRPVGNGRTALRRRVRRAEPMAEYDRLPPELRRWLAGAALPWSPRSARRAWAEALARTAGDRAGALHLLEERQRRRLARDTLATWGPEHPGLAGGTGRGEHVGPGPPR